MISLQFPVVLRVKTLTPFTKKQLPLESNHSLDKSIISNGERVKYSNCAKYLGVKLESKVKFSEHADFV